MSEEMKTENKAWEILLDSYNKFIVKEKLLFKLIKRIEYFESWKKYKTCGDKLEIMKCDIAIQTLTEIKRIIENDN